ncbi:MAG: YceD family protein [bacterium]
MKIDVSGILKEPGRDLAVEKAVEADQLDLKSEQLELAGKLQLKVDIHHSGQGLLRTAGEYKVPLTVFCSRCLEPFSDHIEGEIKGVFVPEGYGEEIEYEDGEYRVEYTEETISLWSLISQDILVRIPMQPLCDSDCRGLCPVCGQNLNEGDCGHSPEPSTSMSEQLKQIDIDEEE